MNEPRLAKRYKDEIIPEMRKRFDEKNQMALPQLQKIVINMGVGDAISDVKILDTAMKDLERVTGQRPQIRRSKKAISNFKLRENMPVGCKVTLRRARMYEFLDRFISVCLPRIRDFNGVSLKSFDKQGNYSLGITDQSIFPEIDTGNIQRSQGMDITFVFKNGSPERSQELLSLLGIPFRKQHSKE